MLLMVLYDTKSSPAQASLFCMNVHDMIFFSYDQLYRFWHSAQSRLSCFFYDMIAPSFCNITRSTVNLKVCKCCKWGECQFKCMCVCVCTCMCVSLCLFVDLSICLICQTACLSVSLYLSFYACVYKHVHVDFWMLITCLIVLCVV